MQGWNEIKLLILAWELHVVQSLQSRYTPLHSPLTKALYSQSSLCYTDAMTLQTYIDIHAQLSSQLYAYSIRKEARKAVESLLYAFTGLREAYYLTSSNSAPQTILRAMDTLLSEASHILEQNQTINRVI